jgi:hypothetical protein
VPGFIKMNHVSGELLNEVGLTMPVLDPESAMLLHIQAL